MNYLSLPVLFRVIAGCHWTRSWGHPAQTAGSSQGADILGKTVHLVWVWEEARTHADMREHADGPQKGLGPAVNWTQETVARMKQMNRITAANFRSRSGYEQSTWRTWLPGLFLYCAVGQIIWKRGLIYSKVVETNARTLLRGSLLLSPLFIRL